MFECWTQCISAGVRTLRVAELSELLEEVETAIRHYSEELVRQLALRDELDFEKEVMNSFISVLIDVQNLQKEHKELLKKKRKVKSGVREQNSRLHRLSATVSEHRLLMHDRKWQKKKCLQIPANISFVTLYNNSQWIIMH